MDTPTHYSDVCAKALDAKEKYNLTDTQTLLYNHICRGDFKLRNEDGQLFYDEDNEGFGWSGDRNWVKKQFDPLIKAGLVKIEKVYDCKGSRNTSWYFYCPEFNLNELIDAACYVSTWKLAMIKHYLKLEDGFDKRNKTYGDIEFIYKKTKFGDSYTFKYKGEASIYSWDHNGKGEKHDLSWLSQGKDAVNQSTWLTPRIYGNIGEMIHDIWSFLCHDGCKQMNEIPNYTTERIFTL